MQVAGPAGEENFRSERGGSAGVVAQVAGLMGEEFGLGLGRERVPRFCKGEELV